MGFHLGNLLPWNRKGESDVESAVSLLPSTEVYVSLEQIDATLDRHADELLRKYPGVREGVISPELYEDVVEYCKQDIRDSARKLANAH